MGTLLVHFFFFFFFSLGHIYFLLLAISMTGTFSLNLLWFGHIALSTYEGSLLNIIIYFLNVLDNIYDQEDPRTWNSICLKCNSGRGLAWFPSYCF